MPTVSQSAGEYIPRRQLTDNYQTGNYRYVNGPSNEPFTSSEQSYSVVKVLDVDSLIEIPTKPKRSFWMLNVIAGLCCLLVVAASILIPLLIIYLSKSSTSSTTSTTPSTTTIYVPTFCNATCYITSRAALSTYTAVWTFESSTNDILNAYNGTAVNSPGYTTGYVGQALSLTGTQYVLAPFINFAYSSFTIEAWIKPTTLANNGASYAIFGECDTTGATLNNCLNLLLQNNITYKLYMGFWGYDLSDVTTLSSSQGGTWIHIAFVYDYSLKQQIIYQNGYKDTQATLSGSPAAYIGSSGLVNIGAQQTNNRFVGLIDHMFVSNRAKSACEILDDATLVAYYTFDSGSVQDSGPNYLTGTATSNVTVITGYINQAFYFGSSAAYFYVGGLISLGTSSNAFSFSFWIKPTAYSGGGTIIHIANGADGYTNGGFPWCVPFIGLDSTNRLIVQVWIGSALSLTGSVPPLNIWTHVVETYSTTNGVTLYVNGTQIGRTGSASYSASGVGDYILIGYYGTSGSLCAAGSVTPGPFYGAVDELRLYSRELSAADACVLANQV